MIKDYLCNSLFTVFTQYADYCLEKGKLVSVVEDGMKFTLFVNCWLGEIHLLGYRTYLSQIASNVLHAKEKSLVDFSLEAEVAG